MGCRGQRPAAPSSWSAHPAIRCRERKQQDRHPMTASPHGGASQGLGQWRALPRRSGAALVQFCTASRGTPSFYSCPRNLRGIGNCARQGLCSRSQARTQAHAHGVQERAAWSGTRLRYTWDVVKACFMELSHGIRPQSTASGASAWVDSRTSGPPSSSEAT